MQNAEGLDLRQITFGKFRTVILGDLTLNRQFDLMCPNNRLGSVDLDTINLPLGPYNVEVSKEGFATAVESGVVLQVNGNPAVPVVLKVGAVAERVSVEANASQVETMPAAAGKEGS